jgi:hypothetical protein
MSHLADGIGLEYIGLRIVLFLGIAEHFHDPIDQPCNLQVDISRINQGWAIQQHSIRY